MNDFENAIDNCPYSTNWFEMRNNMLSIVGSFIEKKECEWHHVYEKELGSLKFHCIAFYIYDSLYVWTDTIENGLIESSQLDKPYNDYMAKVLYCNVENSYPFAPMLFKWIDEKDIVQIC